MIKDLEAAIGYRFQNIQLLQNALTHSSYANERWHNSLLSNERLEFLGDSILGMVVAEYLYRSFPDRPEGELTRMRADMVCEQTLAAAANRIGIGEHLLLGHGEERFGGRSRNRQSNAHRLHQHQQSQTAAQHSFQIPFHSAYLQFEIG